MFKRCIAALLLGGLIAGASAGVLFAHTVELKARMNGEKEVPGPGDENGSGVAKVDINEEEGTVCFKVRFSGIGKSTMAHIHKGTRGNAGDPVVTLWTGKKGSPVEDCVDVKSGLAEKIQNNPKRYYVNVHTDAFPGGAIRGQLKVAG